MTSRRLREGFFGGRLPDFELLDSFVSTTQPLARVRRDTFSGDDDQPRKEDESVQYDLFRSFHTTSSTGALNGVEDAIANPACVRRVLADVRRLRGLAILKGMEKLMHERAVPPVP